MKELSSIKNNFIYYIDHLIQSHRLSHAYLVEIDDYDCDMVFVIDFIKMILCNCSYEEIKKSNNSIIHLIDENNYPDLKIIEPEGSVLKKSQMLDLQKEYNNKSLLDNKRIYVIKNAEKLNGASANTMLKFLEEPEDDIIAILLTDNRYHVLDTILSRCQILSLKEDHYLNNISDDLIEILKFIIHPRDFFIHYNYFINELVVDKNAAKDKFLVIESLLIQYLNYEYIHSSCDERCINLLANCDNIVLLNVLSVLEEEIPKLEYNLNYKLWIDSLFSKLIIGG